MLLRGESGTGKELIARAIHYNSARRDGPFVKLDCTTIPPTLMENELFGHERGAYTGAEARARGKCEAADGGTLFIDEIGELPLPLQAKLLRFLQDREFERVGGTRTLSADVRVVTATHRDLEALVGRGEFREDLYYRVKVVQLPLPPLRERGAEDIVRLAEHFLDVYRRKHGKPLLRFGAAARRAAGAAPLARQHPRARALRRERGGPVRGRRDRRRAAGAAARPARRRRRAGAGLRRGRSPRSSASTS